MSRLLDSLRRAKQVDAAVPPASVGGRQVKAILSTLGYARRQRRARALRLAVGGLGVALVTLLSWVMWERSPLAPATQIAADVSADAVAALVERPGIGSADGRAGESVEDSDPVSALPGLPVADITSPSPLESARPIGAVEAAEGGVTAGTQPLAVEEAVHAAPVGGLATPAPVASESRGDALVPRLVGTGAEPASAPAGPVTAQNPAGATAEPVDAEGTVQARLVEPFDPAIDPMIDPGPPVTEVFAVALTLQQAGDIAGAIAEYQTLLVEGAPSPQVHNNLGLLYQKQNRLADAAQEFQRAIAIDSRHTKAYNNLGVVRMRQVRHQDAAAAFRDARRLDSTNLDAWVNLALALQAAGDPAAARRTLVDALSVDAQHAPTHYNLARLFELGGESMRAIEHYGRFLENSGAEYAELAGLVKRRVAALHGRVRR